MIDLVKMKAKIRLFDLPNGRRTPFISGYRPLFNFAGAPFKTSGKVDLIDKEVFQVGMSDIVYLTFIKGIIDESYFKTGIRFTFDEGSNTVLGDGEFI